MIKNFIINELSELIKKLAFVNIIKAQEIIKNSFSGNVKKEYVINAIIKEISLLPLPPRLKFIIIIFGFVLRAVVNEQVQLVFDDMVKSISQAEESLKYSEASK